MASKTMNKAEFGRFLGVSKQYVNTLKKQDRLVLNDNGEVEVIKTLNKIEKLSDPSKNKLNFIELREKIKNWDKIKQQETKERNKEKDIKELDSLDIYEEVEEIEEDDEQDFNKSKSRKEYYLSLKAKTQYLKECEKLIDVDLVELQYFNIARMLRDKMFNIRHRISNQLAMMDNPVEIGSLLDKEIRLVFSEIEQALEEEIREEEESGED